MNSTPLLRNIFEAASPKVNRVGASRYGRAHRRGACFMAIFQSPGKDRFGTEMEFFMLVMLAG